MQNELFENTAHDPKGKVKIKLGAGVKGDAIFCGPNDCFRPMLRRWVGEEFPEEYALFIGMNPSVAGAHVNDPTIGREWTFTTDLGYSGMIKVNVSDYRATHPKDFLTLKGDIVSDINMQTIMTAAKGASVVIAGHGNLNSALLPLGRQVIAALRSEGIKIMCLGLTDRGFPRHPLYIARKTKIREWHA